MKYTENYNLKKPDYTDLADIPENFNGNFDIVDTELKERDTRVGPLASLTTLIKTSIVNAINSLRGEVNEHKADTATNNVHGLEKIIDNSKIAIYGINANQLIDELVGGYKRTILNNVIASAPFCQLDNGNVKFLENGLYRIVFTALFDAQNEGWRQLVIGQAGNALSYVRLPAVSGAVTILQTVAQARFSTGNILQFNTAISATVAINLLSSNTRITITKVGDF